MARQQGRVGIPKQGGWNWPAKLELGTPACPVPCLYLDSPQSASRVSEVGKGDGSSRHPRMHRGPRPGSWTGRFHHFPSGPFKSLLFPYSLP